MSFIVIHICVHSADVHIHTQYTNVHEQCILSPETRAIPQRLLTYVTTHTHTHTPSYVLSLLLDPPLFCCVSSSHFLCYLGSILFICTKPGQLHMGQPWRQRPLMVVAMWFPQSSYKAVESQKSHLQSIRERRPGMGEVGAEAYLWVTDASSAQAMQ